MLHAKHWLAIAGSPPSATAGAIVFRAAVKSL